jgi:hypothetical protein
VPKPALERAPADEEGEGGITNKGHSTEERRVVISAIRDWRRSRDFYFADSMIMSLAYFILRRLRQSRTRTTPPRTPGAALKTSPAATQALPER